MMLMLMLPVMCVIGNIDCRHSGAAVSPCPGATSWSPLHEAAVDTSMWVGHFRQRDWRLVALLDAGMVVCHAFVVVEVACGTPPGRSEIIDRLGQLESLPVASPDELLVLLQRRALLGRGCGFVDISLLASARLSNHRLLWTMDQQLAAVANELGLAYRPALAA